MSATGRQIYDTAVVGSGPAGCSAATALARQGLTVLLLEKAALPRYKTCGGGILPRAWKLLPPGASAVVQTAFNSALVNFQNDGLHFTAARTEPLVRMAMRAELDHHLAAEAQKSGATLVDGCPVRHVNETRDLVELATEKGVYRARFVVAADGAQSAVAKACGWAALPNLAPALEWELHLPPDDFARHGGTARFDFGFVDAGYAWVFPKRAHLSAGILTTGRANIQLAGKLEEYLNWLGIRQPARVEKHGFVIPLEPRRGPLFRGRVLLAGDAAGLADPITAEGISHALLSGKLAAEAIAARRAHPGKVGPHYQALLQKQILADLRAGRWLAQFVYHRPRIRRWAFRAHGQRLTDFAARVVFGERSYSEALRDPFNYLKLFRRPRAGK